MYSGLMTEPDHSAELKSEAAPPDTDHQKREVDPHPIGTRLEDFNALGFSTVGLFVLALLWTLRASATVAMPLALAFVLYLLLRPLVELMERIRIPAALGSFLVLAGVVGAVVTVVSVLDTPARKWVERIPSTLTTLEHRLDSVRGQVAEVQRAAEQVEEITDLEDSSREQKVQIREPGLLEYVVERLQSLIIGGVITLATLYFMLIFGRPLIMNLLASSPPEQSPAIEFDAIRSIERYVSGYLLTITFINCILGVVVAAVMALLDMPNPLLWGVMATVVNFIPYLGAMVGAVILAVVGLVSFQETGQALLPALIYYGLTVTEGTIITPIILGRTHRLNPLVLFVWLILWGWLWGIMGALLAVPMLVTFKIICDSLPQYRRLSMIIGRSS